MINEIRGDIAAKAQMYNESPATLDYLRAVFQRSTLAVAVYRFGRWVKTVRIPVLSQALKAFYYVVFYLVQMFTGISIQAYANIGQRFVVRNFSCIFVLAERVGSNFTVSEGVTVGNIRGKGHLPIIGDNVYLEPGCKVLGSVTIGDNVIVRANTLVLGDVPSNSIVIGNPPRIKPMPEEAAA